MALFLFDDRALAPGRNRGSPKSLNRGLLFRLQLFEVLVVDRTPDRKRGEAFPVLSIESSSATINKE